MQNRDLTTVFVILSKNYVGDNPARVIAVVDCKDKALSWCGEDSTLKDHYWYEEVAL